MRRIVMVLVVLCSLLAPVVSSAGATAQRADQPRRLDLAAVVPTPGELDDAGFAAAADYTLSGTGVYGLDDDVSYLSELLEVDVTDIERALIDAGYVDSYLAILSLRDDPFDPESALLRDLQFSVFTFVDEEGAADAYAVLSDEGNAPSAEDVRGAAFGDESELTRRSGDEDPITGLPFQELELQFLAGRVVVAVSIFAYGDEADEPAIDEMEALGGVIEARIDAILDGSAPDLTRFVPLLEPEPGAFPYVAYLLRDGEPIPNNYESVEAMDARVESYGGAEHALSYQQQILYGEDGIEDDFFFYANLLQFASEEDAVAFVEASQERLEANPSFVDFREYDEGAGFGDASIAFERTVEVDGETLVRNQINIAVGDVVAAIWVTEYQSKVVIPIEPVLELAKAQAACLEDGGCTGTIPLPAGIVD